MKKFMTILVHPNEDAQNIERNSNIDILIVNKIQSLPKTNYIYNFNVCDYCVVVANSLKTIKSWELNGENYLTRLVKLVCRNLERIETDGILNQLYLKELICDNVKYLDAQCIRKNLCLSDIRCHKAQQISKHAFYACKAIKSVKSLGYKPGKEVLQNCTKCSVECTRLGFIVVDPPFSIQSYEDSNEPKKPQIVQNTLLAVSQNAIPARFTSQQLNGIYQIISYSLHHVQTLNKCINVVSLTLLNIKEIDSSFNDMYCLKFVNAPKCRTVDRSFKNDTALSEVRMEKCTELKAYTFMYSSGLQKVAMPSLQTIGQYCFSDSGLSTASFPKCTLCGKFAFSLCAIRSIDLGQCREFEDNVFAYQRGSMKLKCGLTRKEKEEKFKRAILSGNFQTNKQIGLQIKKLAKMCKYQKLQMQKCGEMQ